MDETPIDHLLEVERLAKIVLDASYLYVGDERNEICISMDVEDEWNQLRELLGVGGSEDA